jgi:serine/threonine-protein phosphatase 2A regulatory subunit B
MRGLMALVAQGAFLWPSDTSTTFASHTTPRSLLLNSATLAYSFFLAPAVFEEEEDAAGKSYFSEIIASVSDIEFTPDGRHFVARDYLSVKVWDLAMERGPVAVLPVHEYLRPKLSELYESDCIFDKFRVSSSGSGKQVVTGSYNNCVKVYDVVRGTETMVELSKQRPKTPVVRRIVGGVGIGGSGFGGSSSGSPTGSDVAMGDGSSQQPPGGGGNGGRPGGDGTPMQVEGFDGGGGMGLGLDGEGEAPPVNPDELDFGKKVLHYSWHPYEDIIAVAGLNNLFIYHA